MLVCVLVHMFMRRPEDHIGVVLLLPTLFFCNRVSHRSSVYQLAKAGWSVTPRYLPIYPSCAGNTAICHNAWFSLCGSWGFSSGSHAYKADMLQTEPSL